METMKRVLDSDCKVHYSVYWPTDANSMTEAGPQPTMADLRLLENATQNPRCRAWFRTFPGGLVTCRPILDAKSQHPLMHSRTSDHARMYVADYGL